MIGDRGLRALAMGATALIVLAVCGVVVFLAVDSVPAMSTTAGAAGSGSGFLGYAAPLAFGTLLAAGLALAIALPITIGVALAASHYVPVRLATPLGLLVDLLAAVPSVVYGLWGIFVLAPPLVPVYAWLGAHLSFIPLFAGPASVTGRTILTAALVLAVMILPIGASLCREVFLRAPLADFEGALALGATRWEAIRLAVLRPSRSGIVAAATLSLGRALGETMAVAMVLSATNIVSLNLISSVNPGTIAANIALSFPDSSGTEVNVLIATGLVLFAMTLVVNAGARAVVRGSRGPGIRRPA